MSDSDTTPPIRLAGLLSSIAPNRVFIAVVLGSLAGFAYALVIPIVLMSVQQSTLAHSIEHMFDPAGEGGHFHLFGMIDISTPRLALAFLIICFFILVCRFASQSLLTRIAIDATIDLRKKIYRRISCMPIQDLERIGLSRLLTALNSDVSQVVRGAAVFPALFASVATVIGLLGFLIYLNLSIFLFIMLAILFGAITYQIPIHFGRRFMSRARACLDRIQEGIRGLLHGAKELKLNRRRKDAFLSEDLDAVEDEFSALQKRGDTLVIFGLAYGDLISFFAIGVVTYALANYYSISREGLIGVVMVMLYITAPIVTLLNAVGPIVQASVAASKLQTLLQDMPTEVAGESHIVLDCQSIVVKGVCFKYHAQERFCVGPIDLSLKRGEVTFLVGGNGSGKTTLGKLLSLHYLPLGGEIYFDQTQVTQANRDACRQSISAIYSDFYLFTKLFGVTQENAEQLARSYLKDLDLDGSVSLADGEFSSTKLSDGQKKRLALLVTFLEDRSIYIFDEWASDQDPAFKNIFYHHVVPNLRRQNKLVIVITHDDRYFHLADRILWMENGKVIRDEFLNDANRGDVTRHLEGPTEISAAPVEADAEVGLR